ncbi:MAG: mevalonate kinase [Candidatus Micrarchaeota archaeon]
MSEGIGYGKVILFGEHFVVHGTPAIAVGISSKCVVELEKQEEMEFVTDAKGTIPELTNRAIANVTGAMDVKDNFQVFMGGNLPTCGGLGSSAAFSVAMVRAFANYYGMKLTEEQVNKFAYEGEKAFHGNPSGIDNVIATYGGAIEYTKGKEFQKLKIGKPFSLVVGITGKTGPTKKMVESVQKFKDSDPGDFQSLQDRSVDIVRRGKKALATGDFEDLGILMNSNQQLLKEIGVSLDINDELVKKMLDAGALGSKLTGGGGGGCCIALAKDALHAQNILKEIKPFEGFVTEVK